MNYLPVRPVTLSVPFLFLCPLLFGPKQNSISSLASVLQLQTLHHRLHQRQTIFFLFLFMYMSERITRGWPNSHHHALTGLTKLYACGKTSSFFQFLHTSNWLHNPEFHDKGFKHSPSTQDGRVLTSCLPFSD